MKGLAVAAEQEKPVGTEPKNLLSICLAIIILLLCAFAIFGDRGVMRILQAREQKQQLEQKLTELKLQQQQLKQEIERLQKDKSYWELLARTRLGMVREGELIYYLPDDENTTGSDVK
jgi:cell division protein FtsB